MPRSPARLDVLGTNTHGLRRDHPACPIDVTIHENAVFPPELLASNPPSDTRLFRMASNSSPLELVLEGSIYSLTSSGQHGAWNRIMEANSRLGLLRQEGRLGPDILKRHYGQTIFEQVAESNALEGSTLSVGETEVAILKGVTLTGHDPRFVRDAHSLHAALLRLRELSVTGSPSSLETVQEVHGLILADHPLAGQFRTQPVQIRGSTHRPPRTWREILDQMEQWERWSKA